MAIQPSGIVSFLFCDIEDSTTRFEAMSNEQVLETLAQYITLLSAIVASFDGHVYNTLGDAVQAVFDSPRNATLAAIEGQRALIDFDWGVSPGLKVRMALHMGEAKPQDGDYRAKSLYEAHRIMTAGHGGQILLSASIAEFVRRLLPPGCQLIDLREQRLRGVTDLIPVFQLNAPGLPTTFPPLRTEQSYLKTLTGSFVDRLGELEALRQLIQADGERLITLVGVGGIGKTRLALRVGAELQKEFSDGARFVALCGIEDWRSVTTKILLNMEIRDIPGPGPEETLINHLRPKHLLLILDCFDLVSGGVGQVKRLVEECPRLTVLLTSTTAMHTQGGRIFQVPPLAVPHPHQSLDADAMVGVPSVDLFLRRIKEIYPRVALTEGDAFYIAEICRQLQGVPLVIEMVAAKAALYPLDVLLGNLRAILPTLKGGASDDEIRHQTVHGTVAWTFEILPDEDQVILRRLAIFNGGFTFQAAAEICFEDTGLTANDIADHSISLFGVGLLRTMHAFRSEPRFSMLDIVRHFGLGELARMSEQEELNERHALYYTRLAERSERELTGMYRDLWIARFEDEVGNFQAALGWALSNGRKDIGLRLATALARSWHTCGRLSEGRKWLEMFLKIPNANIDQELDTKARWYTAMLAGGQGHLRAAEERCSECLLAYHHLDNTLGTALTETLLGVVLKQRGELLQARLLLQSAQDTLETVQPNSDQLWGLTTCHSNLGAIDLEQGRLSAAEQHFLFVHEQWTAVGDKVGLSNSLHYLATLDALRGHYDQAVQRFQNSIFMSKQVNDMRNAASSMAGLGQLYCGMLKEAGGLSLLTDSLALSEQIGDHLGAAFVLLHLATQARRQKKSVQASEFRERASDIYDAIGDKWGMAYVRMLDGHVALDRRRLEEALAAFTTSLALFQEVENFLGGMAALDGLARYLHARNNAEQAVICLATAQAARSAAGIKPLPRERNNRAQLRTQLRRSLGDVAFQSTWEHGMSQSIADTVASMLAMS